MGISLYDESWPLNRMVVFTSADGVAYKTLVAQTAWPQRVDNILVVSTSVTAKVVILSLGATEATRLPAVAVVAGAGDGTIPAVDLIAGLPALVAGGLAIQGNTTLSARVTVALEVDEALYLVVLGGQMA